jgi:hypothetical protein
VRARPKRCTSLGGTNAYTTGQGPQSRRYVRCIVMSKSIGPGQRDHATDLHERWDAMTHTTARLQMKSCSAGAGRRRAIAADVFTTRQGGSGGCLRKPPLPAYEGWSRVIG